MNLLFWIVPLVLLAGLALGALWKALRLRRALHREREENQQLRKLIQYSSRDVQSDLNTLRQLRPDLRHYLRMANAPLSEESAAALRQALEQPLASQGTENWALAELEHYYCVRGEELGFQTDIQLNLSLPWEELLPDLCLVVSNLLENALEALQREGGGWVRARSLATSGYVSLVVCNSCTKPLRMRNGRYLSSKGNSRVGVGLSTVQEIAQRYGGRAEFFADGVQFRAAVFLPCNRAAPPSGTPSAPTAHTAQDAAPSDAPLQMQTTRLDPT